MIRKFCCAVALVGATFSFAFADTAEYLDDRSNAEALVRSLYNAVNRKEYARAWAYFGDQKPAKDFKTFVQGYEKTESVVVETGPASEEGAAGSIYYQVPVAIRARSADGSENTFAGCFTARLVQPAIQEPPFRPLHLEKGTLQRVQGNLAEVLPAACGDGPPPVAQDKVREKIVVAFHAAYDGTCDTRSLEDEQSADPEIIQLSYYYSDQSAAEPPRQARLFRFACIGGPYNTAEVYYYADALGSFRQLQFAEPELDIRYEDESLQDTVETVNIIGYQTADMLVNSFYDESTLTLHSFTKWRGAADVSSLAVYMLRDGAFTLVKYEVDASYDEEINPQTVLDYETAP